jgi:hypothetical protein
MIALSWVSVLCCVLYVTQSCAIGYVIGFIALVLILIIACVIVIVAVVRKRAAKRKLAEVYGEGRPLEQFETISAKPPSGMQIERLSEIDSEGPNNASMHRFQTSMPLNSSSPELERMRSAMDVRARGKACGGARGVVCCVSTLTRTHSASTATSPYSTSFQQAQPTLSLVVEPLTDSDE